MSAFDPLRTLASPTMLRGMKAFRRHANLMVAALACGALVPTDAVAKPPTNSSEMCRSWFGKYSGKLSAGQSFFGQPEKVAVLIGRHEISVQIWEERGGAFVADSVTFACTRNRLQSLLDTGADGVGKISLSMRRDRTVHLRLWGYKEGEGPNKAGFLPPDKVEISLKRVTSF